MSYFSDIEKELATSKKMSNSRLGLGLHKFTANHITFLFEVTYVALAGIRNGLLSIMRR